jgi:isopentenyldiphosphate isomerase
MVWYLQMDSLTVVHRTAADIVTPSRLESMSSRDESVTIVDLDNRLVGTASRGVMRHFHLPHRATYVLVLNGKSEVFVHKRTGEKDIYPGYYCPVFGGVVAAGESYEEAAIRELAEEAGIRDVPLQTLCCFYGSAFPAHDPVHHEVIGGKHQVAGH